MVVCELGSHKCPHIACVSESVKQHDCRTLSANSDMNCRAVGLNLLSTEVGRKYTRGSGDDGDGLFGCIHKGVSFLFGVIIFRESVCLRAGFGVAVGYDCFHDPSKPPAWRFEKFSVLIGPISILNTYARTRPRPRPRALLRDGGGKRWLHPSLEAAASHSGRHYHEDQTAGGTARAAALRQDGAAVGTDPGR